MKHLNMKQFAGGNKAMRWFINGVRVSQDTFWHINAMANVKDTFLTQACGGDRYVHHHVARVSAGIAKHAGIV